MSRLQSQLLRGLSTPRSTYLSKISCRPFHQSRRFPTRPSRYNYDDSNSPQPADDDSVEEDHTYNNYSHSHSHHYRELSRDETMKMLREAHEELAATRLWLAQYRKRLEDYQRIEEYSKKIKKYTVPT